MFLFLVCMHLNNAAVLQLGIIPNYVSSHKHKELSQHSPIIYSFVAIWSIPEDLTRFNEGLASCRPEPSSRRHVNKEAYGLSSVHLKL